MEDEVVPSGTGQPPKRLSLSPPRRGGVSASTSSAVKEIFENNNYYIYKQENTRNADEDGVAKTPTSRTFTSSFTLQPPAHTIPPLDNAHSTCASPPIAARISFMLQNAHFSISTLLCHFKVCAVCQHRLPDL